MTSMMSHRRVVQALEKAERLRRLGSWSCAFGVTVFFLGVMSSGLLPSMSPKSTTNVYDALEGTGYMRWLFLPMMAVSLAWLSSACCCMLSANESRTVR